jgi:hypothetical protein
MEGAGARGLRQDAERCVLASYLNAVLGADARVGTVAVGTAVTVIKPSRRWARKVTVRHPAGVEAFVRAFDAGTYPVLERPVSHEPRAS